MLSITSDPSTYDLAQQAVTGVEEVRVSSILLHKIPDSGKVNIFDTVLRNEGVLEMLTMSKKLFLVVAAVGVAVQLSIV